MQWMIGVIIIWLWGLGFAAIYAGRHKVFRRGKRRTLSAMAGDKNARQKVLGLRSKLDGECRVILRENDFLATLDKSVRL